MKENKCTYFKQKEQTKPILRINDNERLFFPSCFKRPTNC